MNIEIDSRKVHSGDIFFCFEEDPIKAKKFIQNAIANGASKVFTSQNIQNNHTIIVKNIWAEFGAKLHAIYNEKPKKILVVTGTNGKTSTAWFVQQIFHKLEKKCLYIGTIGVSCGDKMLDEKYFSKFNLDILTTPDIASLHQILYIAKTKIGCDVAIIEASSHGILQKRIDFLNITSAGFTNFTQDHLDYHKNMDAYFAAKLELFTYFVSEDGTAIINSDDKKSIEIIKNIKCKNIITYGKNGNLKLDNIGLKKDSQVVHLSYNNIKYSFFTEILGEFQIYNILCSIGFALSCGENLLNIISILDKISPPLGRLQGVKFKEKYTNIYIDYAHTPDALENALLELRKICKGRLICVFGCGGNRDESKRSIMGKISVSIANFTIVTDDNPRTENPFNIRKQIVDGIVQFKTEKMKTLKEFPIKRIMLFALQEENIIGNFLEIEGRREAIQYAISMMSDNDILLIAGKGHESYQIIGTQKTYFSDEEEVIKCLQ